MIHGCKELLYARMAILFKAIESGKVNVVTDSIKEFNEKGLKTDKGTQLNADIVVCATGINLLVLGGIQFYVDGEAIDFSKKITYRGLMFAGVPNICAGYLAILNLLPGQCALILFVNLWCVFLRKWKARVPILLLLNYEMKMQIWLFIHG